MDIAINTGGLAGRTWTVPAGGFMTWLILPEHVDTIARRDAATAVGVACVPGALFYADGRGRNEHRLSFSHLTEADLAVATQRLGGVLGG